MNNRQFLSIMTAICWIPDRHDTYAEAMEEAMEIIALAKQIEDEAAKKDKKK